MSAADGRWEDFVRRRSVDRRLPAGCALAALLVYVTSAAPGVGFFDGGELTAAAFGLGVSHPPGQPLYSLLGKLASLLPLGDVAFRTNLLSAIAAAVAVGLVVAIALALDCGIGGALASAIVLGASPLLLLQATRAEVYAPLLAILLGATLVVVRAIGRPEGGGRHALAASLLFGLAAAIHPLLAAAVAVPLAIAIARSLGAGRAVRLAPRAIGFALLGLATYAYVRVAASRHPTVDWGGARSAAAFLATVSARAYARNFAFGPLLLAHNLGVLVALLVHGTGGPIALGALTGLVLLRRHRAGVVVAGLLVITLVATAPQGELFPENPDVAGYLLPALAGVALALAAAVGRLGSLAPRLDLLGCALLVPLLVPAWWRADPLPRANRDAETYVEAFLAPLPPAPALALAESDHAIFPLLYEQAVAGARPDVPLVTPDLVTSSWYLVDLARSERRLFVPWIDDAQRRDDLAGRLILGNLERGAVYSERFEVAGGPGFRPQSGPHDWQSRERGLVFELAPPRRELEPDGPAPAALVFDGEMGRRIAAFDALDHLRYRAESDSAIAPRLLLGRAPRVTPIFLYDDREGLATRGDLAWARGDREQGGALLDRSCDAGYAEGCFALALHRLEGGRGQTGEALVALELGDRAAGTKAIELDRAAGLASAAHHPEVATVWLERVLASRPDDEIANVALGELDGQHGDLTSATAHFRAALVANPDCVPALIGLGLALSRGGKPADAIAPLERALALDPRRQDVRSLLASISPRPR